MTKDKEKRMFSELNYFINMLDKNQREKIPNNVLNFINEKQDKQAVYEIEDFYHYEILDETKGWISLIYTDYLASDDEKKIILAKEKSFSYGFQTTSLNEDKPIHHFKMNDDDLSKTNHQEMALTTTVNDNNGILQKIVSYLKHLFHK